MRRKRFFDLDDLSIEKKKLKKNSKKNREEIIRVLPSNTVEEMEANVEGVVEWAAAFEREAASARRKGNMSSEDGGAASDERGEGGSE